VECRERYRIRKIEGIGRWPDAWGPRWSSGLAPASSRTHSVLTRRRRAA